MLLRWFRSGMILKNIEELAVIYKELLRQDLINEVNYIYPYRMGIGYGRTILNDMTK